MYGTGSGKFDPLPCPPHLPVQGDKWGKVSCLRKQDDSSDQDSNRQPSDRKSNVQTTTPPCLHNDFISIWKLKKEYLLHAPS